MKLPNIEMADESPGGRIAIINQVIKILEPLGSQPGADNIKGVTITQDVLDEDHAKAFAGAMSYVNHYPDLLAGTERANLEQLMQRDGYRYQPGSGGVPNRVSITFQNTGSGLNNSVQNAKFALMEVLQQYLCKKDGAYDERASLMAFAGPTTRHTLVIMPKNRTLTVSAIPRHMELLTLIGTHQGLPPIRTDIGTHDNVCYVPDPRRKKEQKRRLKQEAALAEEAAIEETRQVNDATQKVELAERHLRDARRPEAADISELESGLKRLEKSPNTDAVLLTNTIRTLAASLDVRSDSTLKTTIQAEIDALAALRATSTNDKVSDILTRGVTKLTKRGSRAYAGHNLDVVLDKAHLHHEIAARLLSKANVINTARMLGVNGTFDAETKSPITSAAKEIDGRRQQNNIQFWRDHPEAREFIIEKNVTNPGLLLLMIGSILDHAQGTYEAKDYLRGVAEVGTLKDIIEAEMPEMQPWLQDQCRGVFTNRITNCPTK